MTDQQVAAVAGPRHRHVATTPEVAGRLRLVLALVLGYMAVQVAVGLATGSLVLLADAGHMLTDAAAVTLALFAFHFARRPATATKTFGYYRLEVLAAVANGVLLLAVSAIVAWEAIGRLGAAPQVEALPVLAVGAVGLGVNLVALRLLHAGQRHNLNVRGAFLEVVGDVLGSVAVLASAAVILLTGFMLADVIASLLVAALIVPRTVMLLRDAADVLLQATPRGVDLATVRRHILQTDGVTDAHDLHAWTITSGMHVVSAHVVVDERADAARVLDELCRCLSEDFDFEHSTIQLETSDRRRLEATRHA